MEPDMSMCVYICVCAYEAVREGRAVREGVLGDTWHLLTNLHESEGFKFSLGEEKPAHSSLPSPVQWINYCFTTAGTAACCAQLCTTTTLRGGGLLSVISNWLLFPSRKGKMLDVRVQFLGLNWRNKMMTALFYSAVSTTSVVIWVYEYPFINNCDSEGASTSTRLSYSTTWHVHRTHGAVTHW